MNYQNPITALGLSPNLQPSRFELHRLKKKLLAEFEVRDATRVDFNGYSFDRQEVLALLDSLEQEKIWGYHIRIAKHPLLHNFLSDGAMELFENREVLKELQTAAEKEDFKGFWSFMAPYFASQFDEQLHEALRERNTVQAKKILRAELPLSPQFLSVAYRKSYRLLQRQVHDLEGLKQDVRRFVLDKGLKERYLGSEWIELLNSLPDYFAALRNKYAAAFEDIAYDLYKKHKKRRLGRDLLQRALKIEVDSDTQHKLYHLLKQMREFKRNQGKTGARRIVVFAVLVAILLSRACVSFLFDGNRKSSNMDPMNYYISSAELGTERFVSKEDEQQLEQNTKTEYIFLFDEGGRPEEGQAYPAELEALLTFHNDNLAEESADSLETNFKRTTELPYLSGRHVYELKNETQFDIVLFLVGEKEPDKRGIYFLSKRSSIRATTPFEEGELRLFYYAGRKWMGDFRLNETDWKGVFAFLHACDPKGQVLRYNKVRFIP